MSAVEKDGLGSPDTAPARQGWLRKFYDRSRLGQLFLVAAFPTHLWTILLVLADLGWIAERTHMWDALAVGAYGLLAAFVEGTAVFALAAALGFLVSPRWSPKVRFTLLGIEVLVAAIFGMAGQLYFLYRPDLPGLVTRGILLTGRPLLALYALTGAVALAAAGLPAYFVLTSTRFRRGAYALLDRLALLSAVYLVLDAAALVTILVRNL